MNMPKVLHYFALVFGFLTSAFFLVFLIPEGLAYLFEGFTSVIPILLMIIFSVGGFVWEIMKPGKGSLCMFMGGVIMAVYLLFLSGIGEFQMALIFGMPFMIPGLIIYLASKKNVKA